MWTPGAGGTRSASSGRLSERVPARRSSVSTCRSYSTAGRIRPASWAPRDREATNWRLFGRQGEQLAKHDPQGSRSSCTNCSPIASLIDDPAPSRLGALVQRIERADPQLERLGVVRMTARIRSRREGRHTDTSRSNPIARPRVPGSARDGRPRGDRCTPADHRPPTGTIRLRSPHTVCPENHSGSSSERLEDRSRPA